MLFCCENNLYAMGTALRREHAETDLALRADVVRHGRRGRSTGWTSTRCEDATRRAVEGIRGGGGPASWSCAPTASARTRCTTPSCYRDKAEVARWKERDPIELLAARMRADGQLDDAAPAALEDEVAAEVDRGGRAPPRRHRWSRSRT